MPDPIAEVSTIATEDLRQLFDLVLNSLDFGSGFLDNEEVDVLRRIAVLIGVDPMDATPRELATSYPHAFRQPAGNPPVSAATGQPVERGCNRCGRWRAEPPHVEPVPAQPDTQEATDA